MERVMLYLNRNIRYIKSNVFYKRGMRIEGTPSLDATDLKQGISTFKIKNKLNNTFVFVFLNIFFLPCKKLYKKYISLLEFCQ